MQWRTEWIFIKLRVHEETNHCNIHCESIFAIIVNNGPLRGYITPRRHNLHTAAPKFLQSGDSLHWHGEATSQTDTFSIPGNSTNILSAHKASQIIYKPNEYLRKCKLPERKRARSRCSHNSTPHSSVYTDYSTSGLFSSTR